jgi:hypothetical protein
MITPSSSNSGVPPAPREPKTSRAPAAQPETSDRVSLRRNQDLQAALMRTPEVRPEVVDRGKHLAVDPNYPPLAVIESLASLFVADPDVTLKD